MPPSIYAIRDNQKEQAYHSRYRRLCLEEKSFVSVAIFSKYKKKDMQKQRRPLFLHTFLLNLFLSWVCMKYWPLNVQRPTISQSTINTGLGQLPSIVSFAKCLFWCVINKNAEIKFSVYKIKVPKDNSQNRLRSPMSEFLIKKITIIKNCKFQE